MVIKNECTTLLLINFDYLYEVPSTLTFIGLTTGQNPIFILSYGWVFNEILSTQALINIICFSFLWFVLTNLYRIICLFQKKKNPDRKPTWSILLIDTLEQTVNIVNKYVLISFLFNIWNFIWSYVNCKSYILHCK